MLNKKQIWATGLNKEHIGEIVKSYQRHFMDHSFKDPNNLFRKSLSFDRGAVKSKSKSKNRNYDYSSNYRDDSPKKNLKLFLPQIDNDKRTNGSRANSEDHSRW